MISEAANHSDKEHDDTIPTAHAVTISTAHAVPVSETLTFDVPTNFVIKNKEWLGGGDAEITCNDNVMFQMVNVYGKKKVKPSLSRDPHHIIINNMEGSSVLIMKDAYLTSEGQWECELLCPLDPLYPDLETATSLCRVRRKLLATIHNRYRVTLSEPAIARNEYSDIDCVGIWPKKISFQASNKSRKELAWGTRNICNNWQLHVSEGEDVILLIGITCAIDRLSHENRMHGGNIVYSDSDSDTG